MNDNLQEKLNILKKSYIKKLENDIEFLNDLFNNFQETKIEELYSYVHKLSGTCGMYGFSELSNFSTKFEFYLKEKVNTNIDIQELKQKLNEYIQYIKETIKKEI